MSFPSSRSPFFFHRLHRPFSSVSPLSPRPEFPSSVSMAPKKAAASSTGDKEDKSVNFQFHDDSKAHPADGGCIAEAISSLPLTLTMEEVTASLDRWTLEWQGEDGKAKKQGLRGDQKTAEFLGKPGETWHIQVWRPSPPCIPHAWCCVASSPCNHTRTHATIRLCSHYATTCATDHATTRATNHATNHAPRWCSVSSSRRWGSTFARRAAV